LVDRAGREDEREVAGAPTHVGVPGVDGVLLPQPLQLGLEPDHRGLDLRGLAAEVLLLLAVRLDERLADRDLAVERFERGGGVGLFARSAGELLLELLDLGAELAEALLGGLALVGLRGGREREPGEDSEEEETVHGLI